MTGLPPFQSLCRSIMGSVLSTLRGDGSVHAIVVNAVVLQHPVTGAQVVGLVATGGSRKLEHLRADPEPRSSPGLAGDWRPSKEHSRSSGPTTRTPISTKKPCDCC